LPREFGKLKRATLRARVGWSVRRRVFVLMSGGSFHGGIPSVAILPPSNDCTRGAASCSTARPKLKQCLSAIGNDEAQQFSVRGIERHYRIAERH